MDDNAASCLKSVDDQELKNYKKLFVFCQSYIKKTKNSN
jgi:hypothetical protein